MVDSAANQPLQPQPDTETLAEEDKERRSRRASTVSIPLLAIIVVTFFLPSIDACGVSALSKSLRHPELSFEYFWMTFGWFLPPFLTAALLLTMAAYFILLRKSPGTLTGRVTLGLLLWCAISMALSLLWVVAHFFEEALTPLDWGLSLFTLPWLLLSILALPAGGFLVFRARRLFGWERWNHYLGGYAFLVSAHSYIFVVSTTVGDGCIAVYGACIYVGSTLALLLICLLGLIPLVSWPWLPGPHSSSELAE